MSIDSVARVLHEIPAPAREAVSRLVKQITHDLRSPATAVLMETFSSRALFHELRASLADQAESTPVIAEADAVLENLERASQALVDYLSAVEARLAAAPPGDQGTRP
jgi:hypothetical protein